MPARPPVFFTVNVADALWRTSEDFGAATRFESPEADFGRLGINVRVIPPGKPNSYYHAGLLMPFNQSRSATPFVIVSAGMTNLDPKMSGVSSSNKFSASAGVGVKVPINPSLSLRGEIRGYFTAVGNNSGCNRCSYGYNDSNFYQGEANLGLTFRF